MNPDRRLLLNAGAALGAVALMGDALAQRGVAPHIYESAEEAHHHLRPG